MKKNNSLNKRSKFSLSIFCRWSFPKSQGGIPMHNYHLMNLLKEDISISMVSIYDELNSEYFKKINVKYEDIRVPFKFVFNFLNRFKILIKHITILKDWLISKKMFNVFNNINSDVVEFMDIHSESYYLLKKNKSKKVKVIIRSHTPYSLLEKYYSRELKKHVDHRRIFKRELYCFRFCDVITVPSNDLKKQLINLFNLERKKILVLPNIIDTDHFKPQEQDQVKSNFTILHVGRFEKSKGAETLIKSFIELALIYDDINLVNIGKSNFETISKCRHWLNKNKLESRVTFENFVNYEQLPKFYQNADLVIVPSELYESFSYTVAQGMSCGKIVIGSNIGGIPETMNYGKAGILFEPGDTKSLVENIKKIYLRKINLELMENNARNYIVNNFSFYALKKKYFDFYQRQIKLKD